MRIITQISASKIQFLFGMLIFIGLLACTDSAAKKSPQKTATVRIHDFVGEWSGKLNISKMGKQWQTLDMSLDIKKNADSSYQWKIIYSSKDIRNYTLKKGNKGVSHYVMDENNGILLDCFLNDNVLGSMFEVKGSLLICDYRLESDEIIFNIRAGSTTEYTTSGNKISQSDTVPLTHSYVFPMFQSAVLKKKP